MGGIEQGGKTNTMPVFEYPFDFERYIEERLREIEDVEERQFAKKVLSNGLGSAIKCTEEKYQKLEYRIFEELKTMEDSYETCSAIVEKANFGSENTMLFPVYMDDLDESVSRAQLSEETKIYLETVYLELSEREMICFKQDTKFLKGKINTGDWQQEVEIEVRPVRRYRDMVERLYNVLKDNGITWNTINTAYMDKFFDIFLCIENEKQRSAVGDIPEVQFDFGKWKTVVRHGFIPIWNVQKIAFASSGFMTPSPDGVYYEHEFIPEYDAENDGYVVEQNEHILEIRHEQGKIILRSDQGTFEDWIAYRFVQASPALSSAYSSPVLTNRIKNSFMRRYAEKKKSRHLTKMELFRRIMELDIGKYLEISDYKILENSNDFPVAEDMNWFIQDELFPMAGRKILLLIFEEINVGFYLNDAIMNFIISQMQTEISEYRCVGQINMPKNGGQ